MYKKKITQRIAILIYVLLSVLYVVWRACFTLNTDQMVASVVFLFVDIVMCFSTILFISSLWRIPLHSDPLKGTKQFTIDVLVPTYNEDSKMLESTLRHCIDMDYPHKTYLLDDGNRSEIKTMAERLGVAYITREKNTDAKAGNLNHAMPYTQGELIAIFDADFRPEKDFLTQLVDYFNDEKIAVVQVPQMYYNTDSFQHRRISKNEMYSDQDTFMHLVLPARNNWNAGYWIGTNTLMRRKAIESIGGFSTGCVTEDILTSIRIHANGWQIVYVDKPLAYGLAPVNLSEYVVQRLRWAKGAFQILVSHNPLMNGKLTIPQRLFYFSSVNHFFEGGIKIVYYLFPAFFFLFGVVPVYPYPPVIIGMLIYIGVSRLIFERITGGHTNPVMDEIYSVIKSFIYLMAFPTLIFNKNIRFKVTPKGKGNPISIQGITGPVLMLGFNSVAVAVAICNPDIVTSLGMLGWICFLWTLYMGVISFVACFYCIKPLFKNESYA